MIPLTAALLGCAQTVRVNPPAETPVARAIAGAVDSLAARAVAEGLAPALGVAVTMDGRTIYERSHGSADVTAGVPANDRTLWYVASTSKSFTGFGVALLKERFDSTHRSPVCCRRCAGIRPCMQSR